MQNRGQGASRPGRDFCSRDDEGIQTYTKQKNVNIMEMSMWSIAVLMTFPVLGFSQWIRVPLKACFALVSSWSHGNQCVIGSCLKLFLLLLTMNSTASEFRGSIQVVVGFYPKQLSVD